MKSESFAPSTDGQPPVAALRASASKVDDVFACDATHAQALLDSDRQYFRSGAESVDVGRWRILYLPGLEGLAAGCVAEVPEGGIDGSDVDDLEAGMAKLGAPHARWYEQAPNAKLSGALEAAGYRATREIGLIRMPTAATAEDSDKAIDVSLRLVDGATTWREKRQLHAAGSGDPDGHSSDPFQWVTMERRKSESGYMRPFIAISDGVVCGAIAIARCGRLLRLKNVFVHPDYRGMGMASAIMRTALRQCEQDGPRPVGIFAHDHGAALRVYESLGFEAITQQTEWFRTLR